MKVLKKVRKWLRDKLDDDGREKLDATPVEIPIGFERPPTLEEQVRRLMNVEYQRMSSLKDMEGLESPEDADDFDIEDDPIDQNTPYEDYFFATSAEDMMPIKDNPNFTSEENPTGANSEAPSQPEAGAVASIEST